MTIGERITERLEELGLEVAGLAKYCDVTPSAVYAWLNGETKGLKPANLVCAAEYLKTHEKWLATGDGPKARLLRQDDLKEGESELIYDFRDLSDDEKTGMKTAINALANTHRKKGRRQ